MTYLPYISIEQCCITLISINIFKLCTYFHLKMIYALNKLNYILRRL